MTIDDVQSGIKYYRDFPEKGIMFIDLLPLLGDSEAFSSTVRQINSLITCPNVATPEARGFLFATPLLVLPDGIKSLAVFRKSGKMPHKSGDLVKIPIMKEYGDDSIYFRKSDIAAMKPTDTSNPAIEITVFDDVLATGGTAEGMARELNKLTVQTPQGILPVRVREFVFLAEIKHLNARSRLEQIAPVKTVIAF